VAGDLILLGIEQLAPFVVGLHDFRHSGHAEFFPRIVKLDDFHGAGVGVGGNVP